MNKKCLKCNQSYFKRKNCSIKEWLNSKYCSRSCSNSVNSLGTKRCLGRTPWNKGIIMGKSPNNTRLNIICLECGVEFEIQKYRLNQNVRFCSRNCGYKNRDKGISTENEKIRKSVNYKNWRKSVFERDNYTCRECRQHGGYLHADHIKPFAFYPELRFDINNGRTLCVSCHKKTPTYGVGAWRHNNVLAVGQEA